MNVYRTFTSVFMATKRDCHLICTLLTGMSSKEGTYQPGSPFRFTTDMLQLMSYNRYFIIDILSLILYH